MVALRLEQLLGVDEVRVGVVTAADPVDGQTENGGIEQRLGLRRHAGSLNRGAGLGRSWLWVHGWLRRHRARRGADRSYRFIPAGTSRPRPVLHLGHA